jgi:hypothetical protein
MPSLDDVYEAYCTIAAELVALPASSARAQKLQGQADDEWLSYLSQGGGREPWHTPQVAWHYQDGFKEMRHSSADGPVDQLRELLNIPRNVGPVYLGSEQSAVEHFQANHGFPVTGVVDRATWQAILGAKGERKPGSLPRRFEVPGSTTAPVSIVIRTRRRWMLALDDVPYRTYANQNNLAVLAQYAYEPRAIIERELVSEWNKERLREDVLIRAGDDFSKLFVREAPASFEHELDVLEDTRTDTQLFVLDAPRYTVVSFRGTAPSTDSVHTAIQDINTDLDAKGERWMFDGTFQGEKAAGRLGLQIHRGFGQAFDSIRDKLRAKLEGHLKGQPGKPLFVTGHSLGAALACLCACYLRSHPKFSSHPVQLYTYAQPRVGTVAFCRHYWREDPKFSYYRMANVFDTVTMVPSNYLARDVGEVRGLIEPLLERVSELTSFTIPVPERDDWLSDYLKDKCPPELDYRHFGELVLCGVDTNNRPFVQHIGAGLPRVIEALSTPRVQSIWRSTPPLHPMVNYRRLLMREFEQQARAFAAGSAAAPVLCAPPALHPAEVQLFHRYVHSRGIPAYHSMEEYRHAFP